MKCKENLCGVFLFVLYAFILSLQFYNYAIYCIIKLSIKRGIIMEKTNVFNSYDSLKCVVCEKDLTESIGKSMVQVVTKGDKITRISPCCKGACDQRLKSFLMDGEFDGWLELATFANPYLYLKHLLAVMNNMYEGNGFDNEDSCSSYKNLLIKMYPLISRNLTDREIEAAEFDNIISF